MSSQQEQEQQEQQEQQQQQQQVAYLEELRTYLRARRSDTHEEAIVEMRSRLTDKIRRETREVMESQIRDQAKKRIVVEMAAEDLVIMAAKRGELPAGSNSALFANGGYGGKMGWGFWVPTAAFDSLATATLKGSVLARRLDGETMAFFVGSAEEAELRALIRPPTVGDAALEYELYEIRHPDSAKDSRFYYLRFSGPTAPAHIAQGRYAEATDLIVTPLGKSIADVATWTSAKSIKFLAASELCDMGGVFGQLDDWKFTRIADFDNQQFPEYRPKDATPVPTITVTAPPRDLSRVPSLEAIKRKFTDYQSEIRMVELEIKSQIKARARVLEDAEAFLRRAVHAELIEELNATVRAEMEADRVQVYPR